MDILKLKPIESLGRKKTMCCGNCPTGNKDKMSIYGVGGVKD